jgi:hypothetical protein
VIAKDFFDDPTTWVQGESTTLKAARVRANKELSHITAERKYMGDKTKEWDVAGLFAEIEEIAKRFASKDSGNKLHSDVKLFLNEVQPVVAYSGGHSTGTVTQLFPAEWLSKLVSGKGGSR